MTTYLARYHGNDREIVNYDFIFRMKDNVIEKVLYASRLFKMCNYDNMPSTDCLIGLEISRMEYGTEDEPDVFDFVNHAPLKFQQVTRGSKVTTIDKELIIYLAKQIVSRDELLMEAFY
jgi:hypothetical protein